MQGHRSGVPGTRYAKVRPRRHIPRLRLPKSMYWIVAAGAIALSSGFAFGALTFGPFAFSPQQTGASGAPPPPPVGISFPLAQLQLVSNNSSAPPPRAGACATSNLGTNGTPTALVNGTNTTICLSTHGGGYALGDLAYILDVSWNKSAALSTTFQVQVSLIVSPSANSFTATAYVKTSATITSHEGATFAIDLTQANDTAINHYSVLVTEE
jgi:hypothetical protein